MESPEGLRQTSVSWPSSIFAAGSRSTAIEYSTTGGEAGVAAAAGAERESRASTRNSGPPARPNPRILIELRNALFRWSASQQNSERAVPVVFLTGAT